MIVIGRIVLLAVACWLGAILFALILAEIVT